MLIVTKFGGSSLADPDRLFHAAGIISDTRQREQKVLAVVSAVGSTTDELKEMALEISSKPSLREQDALLSSGEQQAAALMAIALQETGEKAVSLTGWQAGILSSGPYGSSDIAFIVPDRIQEALNRGIIPVVAGFQALSPYGDISTLGRGGSDTTAVALSAALNADECRIYTDVDGIYTADPRLCPEARLLKEIDFRDMLTLARSGSQVLHPRAVKLAMANGVKLRLMSSFKALPGTELCFLPDERRPAFAGVTRDEKSCTVSAVGTAASSASLAQLISALGSGGVAVLTGSVEENRVSVKVARAQLLTALKIAHSTLLLK